MVILQLLLINQIISYRHKQRFQAPNAGAYTCIDASLLRQVQREHRHALKEKINYAEANEAEEIAIFYFVIDDYVLVWPKTTVTFVLFDCCENEEHNGEDALA